MSINFDAMDLCATNTVNVYPNEKLLRNKKIDWQQYHHRKCNSLWGMLPLVVGMRVALVDHLDRSTKCLLRGSNGTLTGWQLAGDATFEARRHPFEISS